MRNVTIGDIVLGIPLPVTGGIEYSQRKFIFVTNQMQTYDIEFTVSENLKGELITQLLK